MYLYNKHYRSLAVVVDFDGSWWIEWAFWKDKKLYTKRIGGRAAAKMEFYRMRGICAQ
jgi:hypothetical protein